MRLAGDIGTGIRENLAFNLEESRQAATQVFRAAETDVVGLATGQVLLGQAAHRVGGVV